MPLTSIRFYVANRAWLADLSRPVCLARAVTFGEGAQTWFGAERPTLQTFATGSFVGSVAKGGAVNVSVLTITPHGAGTHTESSGHITRDPLPVNSVAAPGLIPASLVTVDSVTQDALLDAISSCENGFLEALVVRSVQPALSGYPAEALRHAAARGVMHLLVQEASVDPEDDGGRLAAHRAFWGIKTGSNAGKSARTITELIQIPPEASDGPYLLDLQVPNLTTDAVPSRPVLYPLVPTD
ncbi:MAG: arylformamidase [Rhodothermales bacterium]|jgi:arylformamidase